MKAFSWGVRDIDRCAPFLIPVARCSCEARDSVMEVVRVRKTKCKINRMLQRNLDHDSWCFIFVQLDKMFSFLSSIYILSAMIFIIDTMHADNICNPYEAECRANCDIRYRVQNVISENNTYKQNDIPYSGYRDEISRVKGSYNSRIIPLTQYTSNIYIYII